jgi:hypothetical protein
MVDDRLSSGQVRRNCNSCRTMSSRTFALFYQFCPFVEHFWKLPAISSALVVRTEQTIIPARSASFRLQPSNANCPKLQIGFSTVDAFSVPRSEHPRPADARSPSEVRFAPSRFRTPSAKASLGPLPENFLGRLGSGSRRHTLRASMYRTQREIPQHRSKKHVQSHTTHRSHRSQR